MKPLLFVSTQPFSGKSSICVAMGKLLIERGHKTGYMKPLGSLPVKVGDYYVDEDVHNISRILGIKDNLKDVGPLMFIGKAYEDVLKEKIELSSKKYLDIIKKSYKKIAENKDFMLIEGGKYIDYGIFAGLSSKEICSSIDAKAIVIIKYGDDIVDIAMFYKEYFKDFFGGIIINLIPIEDMDRLKNIELPYFKKRGINVIGTMLSDKVLSSVSIKEMAKYIDGKILCANEKKDELVGSFMVGAMGHELALKYFRRNPDKVVITGGDRADIQLAALETKTKCLVLTGNYQPSAIVVGRAEELGIPIVLVGCDTLTAVGKLCEIMGHSRIYNVKKLDKLLQIIKDSIDIEKVISLTKN